MGNKLGSSFLRCKVELHLFMPFRMLLPPQH